MSQQIELRPLLASDSATRAAINVEKMKPLFYAEFYVRDDCCETIQKLRETGEPELDFIISKWGRTPLHFYIDEVGVMNTKLLDTLANTFDAATRNRLGETALHVAAGKLDQDTKLDLVEWICGHNTGSELRTTCDKNQGLPLHALVGSKQAETNTLKIAEVLLKVDASHQVNYRNSMGLTPVHCAVDNGYRQIVELMLSHYNLENEVTGKETLLQFACRKLGSGKDNVDILDKLMQIYGEKINDVGPNGTALHAAVKENNISLVIKLCTSSKLSPSTRDKKDALPIYYAAKNSVASVGEACLRRLLDCRRGVQGNDMYSPSDLTNYPKGSDPSNNVLCYAQTFCQNGTVKLLLQTVLGKTNLRGVKEI